MAALSVAAVLSLTGVATAPVWAAESNLAPCEVTTTVVVSPAVAATAGTPAIPAVPGTPAVAAVPGTPEIPAVAGTPAIPAVPAVEAQHYSLKGNSGIDRDEVPPTPEENPKIWQANTHQEPHHSVGTPTQQPDGSTYIEGESGLHYASHGPEGEGLRDWFYFEAGSPGSPAVPATEGTPLVPAVAGKDAVAAVPGKDAVPATEGTPAKAAVTKTVVSPVDCETEVVPTEDNEVEVQGEQAANGPAIEVLGQQADAPAPAAAPAAAVPTAVNAGLSSDAGNQAMLPASLALLGALLAMVAFATRRRQA